MNEAANAINKVDNAFLFIFGVSFIILVIITLLMIYFIIRYHKSRHPEPADIEGNVLAETLWTVIPILIVGAMFYYGWTGYKALRDVPENAMKISVEAKMWSWKFIYPSGKTSKDLIVPENTPVKLDMTSKDVIHSFYVPAYRIKMDTVPGMQTYVWFNSGKESEYDILCAEYCGARHAFMTSKVKVVKKEQYEKWLNEDKKIPESKVDISILEDKGCVDCHSMDGSVIVGPTFKDIFNRKTVVVYPDGKKKEITADEEYLKNAILNSQTELVEGFDESMPEYKDELTKDELDKIISILKTGGKKAEPEVSMADKGKKIAEDEGCFDCHSLDGEIIVGPSFKGLLDRDTVAIKDGKEVKLKADVRYIISSIKKPGEYIVKDFDESMPPYEHLTDDQIKAIIEFLRTVK